MPFVVRVRSGVGGGDAGDLAEDLARAGVAVRPERQVPPPAAKADAGAIAALVVQGLLSGSAIAAFTRVVVAFVERGAARSVVIESGDERLEITGASVSDQRRLVEAWFAARAEPPG